MSVWATMGRWFGFGGAMGETTGTQFSAPSVPLVDGVANIGPDGALQISSVWACVERRANVIASLPFFAYVQQANGEKVLARDSRLYQLLHESPNARMTPFEFWRAMMLNHDLRGNAYARIDRDSSGEAIAMWPMPADQVTVAVLNDGSMAYEYRIGNDVAVFSDKNVLHLKNLGNGTTGFAKLEFMRATTDEMAKAQTSATKVFGNGGKPTGVLMIDKVLTPEQRAQIRTSFGGLVEGNTARLMVLEAAMTYQQLSISPEDQQLLESRQFGVEEFCRWFDVPPVLIHHSNVTTWGSGVEQIVDGWHKLSIRTVAVNIEQAVRKRVMTPRQRATMAIEFSMDALLRGSLKDRMEIYAKAVQNGVYSRAECRQFENMPPIAGSDQLTAQTNLVPLSMMGKAQPGAGNAAAQEPLAN
jgi:HK97 family phage portal protein